MEFLTSLQNQIDNMYMGDKESIVDGLKSKAAILRINAILASKKNKLTDDEVIENIKKLKNDNTKVDMIEIYKFVLATLDVLGIEKYSGDDSIILAIMEM